MKAFHSSGEPLLVEEMTGLMFEAQPIVSTSAKEVFAYEALYRATPPPVWKTVDEALLRYLIARPVNVPLFINLSNELLHDAHEEQLLAVHEANDIYFEWSEKSCGESYFTDIVTRINSLTKKGLRVVVDDLGSGQDGLGRIAALERLYAAKIDGRLFQRARRSVKQQELLCHLVSWLKSFGTISVAEWVETKDDEALAAKMGFDLWQGFYSRTMPLLKSFTDVGPGIERELQVVCQPG